MRTLASAIVLASVSGAAAAAQTGAAPAGPIEITLERSACFGTCPDYKVTLREDGKVSYEGHQFVRITGNHTWTIDPEKVRTLAAEMQKAGFFELNDVYEAPVTDNPTTFTSLTVGARTKRIKDYVSGPLGLKEIEARIDAVSGVRGYVFVNADAIREMQKTGWRATGEDARNWLWRAAGEGDADTVRALLDAGASARTARTQDGVTIVMQAASSGDADTVSVLLKAGGEPTARDRMGRNAADRARDGIEMVKRDPDLSVVWATGRPRQYELILKLLTDE
jgi:hypothetical protein